MNEKSTGLISLAMIETPAERAKRESRNAFRKSRNAFIDKWKKENPDFVRHLGKWPKDQLIDLLISELVGAVYNKFQTGDNATEREALIFMANQLIKGTLEQQHSAVAKWETEALARADNNITRVTEIVRLAAATKVQIAMQDKVKAFKIRDRNLAKGRLDGVKTRKKTAKDKQSRLTKAIGDLFDKPDKPGWGWTNPEIVKFLKKGNYGYADSSIFTVVKREAAKHRRPEKSNRPVNTRTGE